MESFDEAKEKIVAEITSDDTDVRNSYLERYTQQLDEFGDAMARALLAWRELDSGSEKEAKKAYLSAMVYCAITLHIQSMRLFLSGHPIAAGNLSRQVIEAMALALLASSKELSVLDRFIEDKYSSSVAVRDLLKHKKKVGLMDKGADILQDAQNFFHKFSHPTKMTIALITSFSEDGLYVGASFDEGKTNEYDQEIGFRIYLAKEFVNFIEITKQNIDKW